MKTVFEIIGTFIVSLVLIAVPVLCPLSFVYKWFPGLQIFLSGACLIEWFGLVLLLFEISDIHDTK